MPLRQFHRPMELIRIVIPAVAAVLIFFAFSFALFLPEFKKILLEDRKVMLKELVLSSWQMIQHLDKEVQQGKFSQQEAQKIALEHLQALRYGADEKDYFWINDFHPRMIMHPYRQDLIGQDLSLIKDRAGLNLFQQFVNIAKVSGQWYVTYLWQWKDDPSKIVPKLSFIKAYEPWGWIIGSGIYLDDAEAQTAAMVNKIITVSIVALMLVSLISAHQIHQGLKTLRLRRQAEEELLSYQEQLEHAVQERTEELCQANQILHEDKKEKERLINDLQQALGEVKTLSGFIPICASCKKIRGDQGFWEQIEQYIMARSEAQFSHGICPDCAERLYPELMKKTNSVNNRELS